MSDGSELDLLCFSYLAHARLCQIDEYPEADQGAEITAVAESIAGDGPLVACVAAGFGLRAAIVSNGVGPDTDGRAVVSYLARNGVMYSSPPASLVSTPFAFILTDRAGNREWFSYLDSQARRELMTVTGERLERACMAYIDCYPSIEPAAIRVLRLAKQFGRRRLALLLNLGGSRPSRRMRAAAAATRPDVVQMSLPERRIDVAGSVAREMRNECRADVVVVTLGSLGALALSSDGYIKAPAHQVSHVHLHGAGAAFSAGLVFGYLRSWALTDCVGFAVAVGTARAASPPTVESFTREEVSTFWSAANGNRG